MNNYEDMIELPRPISKAHQPMSLNNRSAQFAPFSALIGYDEKIRDFLQQGLDFIQKKTKDETRVMIEINPSNML